MLEMLAENLLSPVVLAFVLGACATWIKGDLSLPKPIYEFLSVYLLLAIGLKGGVALSKTTLSALLAPGAVTLALGVLTPITAYWIARRLGGLDRTNAAAIAAHYGSVSAVTFIASDSFARSLDLEVEGFLPALVALLEVPAIIVALMIASVGEQAGTWRKALHEVASGRSVLLLIGGILIGWACGEERVRPVTPFFVAAFPGALCLFLLELGGVAASRLRDFARVGPRLITFAVIVPIGHGVLGVLAGNGCGLGLGGSAVLGAMASSASYIAAPAAVRVALPRANPAYYLTTSLGITFPFNLTLGIPLYFGLARWLES